MIENKGIPLLRNGKHFAFVLWTSPTGRNSTMNEEVIKKILQTVSAYMVVKFLPSIKRRGELLWNLQRECIE